MKILFLDVDGVLNCADYFNTRKTPRDLRPRDIDPERVLILHRILEATGAKVVVSSSWRFGEESLKDVYESVSPHETIGTTPKHARHEDRHAEIQEWIDLHGAALNITRYAILDDDACAGFGHGENFFKTEWYGNGLTDEVAAKVIAHLNA